MTDYRAEAEKHLANAAYHLTEHPGDMRIAEVAAAIGNGYATLALLDGRQGGAAEKGQAGKRWRLTTQHLGVVAATYRTASNEGLGPTRAVAEHFKVPHSTAATWVGHARRQGFLPATVKGRAS
jgi:hypothetical protein